MIILELENDYYVVKCELLCNSFNTELLRRIYGMTFKNGQKVYAMKKSKSYEEISVLCKKFLELQTLLKL